MWSPELPRLVSQDSPLADIEPLDGGPRRRAGWLVAGTAALLLAGGISASLALGPQDASHPVGAALAEELHRPREVNSTALRLDAPGPRRTLPVNSSPDDPPASPSL